MRSDVAGLRCSAAVGGRDTNSIEISWVLPASGVTITLVRLQYRRDAVAFLSSLV